MPNIKLDGNIIKKHSMGLVYDETIYLEDADFNYIALDMEDKTIVEGMKELVFPNYGKKPTFSSRVFNYCTLSKPIRIGDSPEIQLMNKRSTEIIPGVGTDGQTLIRKRVVFFYKAPVLISRVSMPSDVALRYYEDELERIYERCSHDFFFLLL